MSDHRHNPSRGLGDTVARLTRRTGIERAVKTLFGEDCGCAERQERLNQWVPYGPRKDDGNPMTPPTAGRAGLAPTHLGPQTAAQTAPPPAAPGPHPLETLRLILSSPAAAGMAADEAGRHPGDPGAADVAIVHFLLSHAHARSRWVPVPEVYLALLHMLGWNALPAQAAPQIGDIAVFRAGAALRLGLVTADGVLYAHAEREGGTLPLAALAPLYLLRLAGG